MAAGEESLGCGLVRNKDNAECCKIGIPCVTCDLKTPSTCCNGRPFPFRRDMSKAVRELTVSLIAHLNVVAVWKLPRPKLSRCS